MRRGPDEPGLRFDWDPGKARTNLAKHGVSFEEATSVFRDPFEIAGPDPDHSNVEERLLSIGSSERGRVLIVGYVERGTKIRVFFARRATKRERQTYEQG